MTKLRNRPLFSKRTSDRKEIAGDKLGLAPCNRLRSLWRREPTEKTPRQIQGLSTVNLQLQTVCYHKLPILGGQEMSRIHKNSGALRENLFWANFDEDLQTPRRGVGWSHLVAKNTATRAILYSSVFLVISQVWCLHVPSKPRVRPQQQTTHPNNMIYLSPEDE